MKKFIVGISTHPWFVMHMDVTSNTDAKNQLGDYLHHPLFTLDEPNLLPYDKI